MSLTIAFHQLEASSCLSVWLRLSHAHNRVHNTRLARQPTRFLSTTSSKRPHAFSSALISFDVHSPAVTSQTRSQPSALRRWLIAVHHHPTTKTQRRESPFPRGKGKTRRRWCHYQNVSQGVTTLFHAASFAYSPVALHSDGYRFSWLNRPIVSRYDQLAHSCPAFSELVLQRRT